MADPEASPRSETAKPSAAADISSSRPLTDPAEQAMPDTPAAAQAIAAQVTEPQQQQGPPAEPSYRLKHINIRGRGVPVVMQNENGPCPLLAIANVLLLRNQIHLPGGAAEATQVCLWETPASFMDSLAGIPINGMAFRAC